MMVTPAPDELLVNDIFRTIKLDEGLLSVQAARQIRELIQAGELRRGERLPSERELCDRLGVSRTVVREAIKMLRASGLVKVRLGVGTFIAEEPANVLEGTLNYAGDQEARKISDLQQVREVLEPAAAALAAQNANPEDIQKIEQAILDMERSVLNGYRYVEADTAFHLALAEATHNSIFVIFVNSIVDLLQEVMRLAIDSPGAGERSGVYHRRILEAILARDAGEACNAMDEHMQQAKLDVQATLRYKFKR
jgi:GntR family transcriptional repressor for pyruvate dehydrogenase complex